MIPLDKLKADFDRYVQQCKDELGKKPKPLNRQISCPLCDGMDAHKMILEMVRSIGRGIYDIRRSANDGVIY